MACCVIARLKLLELSVSRLSFIGSGAASVLNFIKHKPLTELFPISLKLPEGFTYREDFLTPQEEQELLDVIRQVEVKPMIFQGFEAKRKVASFGYDYSFDNRRLTKGFSARS